MISVTVSGASGQEGTAAGIVHSLQQPDTVNRLLNRLQYRALPEREKMFYLQHLLAKHLLFIDKGYHLLESCSCGEQDVIKKRIKSVGMYQG